MGHCICGLFVSEDHRPTTIDEAPVQAEGAVWPRIEIYGAHWCTDTIRTRHYLNRHGVPYILMDVDQDPEAARKVMEWNQGNLSTPTLEIEGRIVTEPSDEELAEILGIGD